MKPGILKAGIVVLASAMSLSGSVAQDAGTDRTPGTAFDGAIGAPKLEAGSNKTGGLVAVNPDGSVAYGVNVKSVTHPKKGDFRVKFKRPVRGCYYFGTPTNPNPGQSSSGATIVTAVPDPSDRKTVIVYTYSTNSKKFFDNGFFLKVDCS